MLSVKGIYDGEKVELLEKTASLKPGKVIITFIDDDSDDIREYVSDSEAFDFWQDEGEDLYQEYLKETK